MVKEFELPSGKKICYLGPDIEEGPLPALFYFALSAEESLTLEPYCNPVLAMQREKLRIFSMTLPCHGHSQDKYAAMGNWAKQMADGQYILKDFIESAHKAIDTLIAENIINPKRLALAGLSRGGFIATHVAAHQKQVGALVCFAPLTSLTTVEEFKDFQDHLRLRIEKLALTTLCEQLTHLHHLRFYIANRDTRVDTDTCIHFVRQMAERVHEKRAKHCKVEMMLTSPIGFKGHGTSPHIFTEGAKLLEHFLIG